MISGRKLYELRSGRCLTLEEAAEQIGVHKSTLCRYEQEDLLQVRPEVRDRICELYGVTPAMLEPEQQGSALWYPLLSPEEVADAYRRLPERDRLRISRMLTAQRSGRLVRLTGL